MYGVTDSIEERGVQGYTTETESKTFGVWGRVDSPEGTGVYGQATESSGTSYGVRGETNSPDGFGVFTPDDAKVGGQLDVVGDLKISGEKNFVQTVPTASGPK